MFPRVVPIALTGILALSACSGGDDAPATTTTDVPVATAAPVTTAASTTTTTTTTTVPPLVTEGATVVVANSSIVGGAAGRMTTVLGDAGFTTTAATNGIDKLDDSIVYYSEAEGAEGAQAVAESVGRALGGVAVEALPDAIPTESGDLGEAQVLVLLGNNQADRTIAELSGSAAADVETNGLTIVVANASGVSGSAGRMTTTLQAAGFTVGTPTNAVVQLADSVVHHTDAEGAQADAEALAAALGGVEVEPMPDEIPTESSELDGDVLLLLGTNQADQSLGTLNP